MRLEPQNGWTFVPGSRGWDHDDWVSGFYPKDLPADWRLTFYANHFSTVLVPEERWLHASEAEIDTWLEDTDEEFRFALEISPPQLGRTATPNRLARLEPKLGLLLLDADATAAPSHLRSDRWPLVWRSVSSVSDTGPRCWVPEAGGASPSARPAAVLLIEPGAPLVTSTARALQAWTAGPPVPVFVQGSLLALQQMRAALELLDRVP